ncbi:outer membrane transport energization protein TonB [Orbus hercynius]|uniref:Protein TonB n=1 Tax=Orbus hercynius TaxID=593135 RepID=A0A495RCU8_9GAMM|nr:TonB family protein [Orbus hercynius]RKS85034.1 outer membrane transport energization protein TonB [Orbus hercynius]
MIAKSNNTKKNTFHLHLSISILLHVLAVGILLFGALFSERIVSVDGDNSIKAVMIDLSMLAAPKQSLAEDAPQIEQMDEQPIAENKQPEITPEDIKPDPDIAPDIIVETKPVETLVPPETPQLLIKEKVLKPKDHNQKKQIVKKSSQQQIKQETATENFADTAVAPKISENNQFSATPTPISRKNPIYPTKALDMRIEGYVVAVYDINAHGQVENIRIIEAKPNSIFNKSVTQAMKQWKYQAIKKKDLTIKIVFNRDKSIKLDTASR